MRLSVFLFCCLVLPAHAQQPAPPDLQPLPEPPPPPEGQAADPSLEPQVTTVRRGENLVEEYRVKGRLFMLKVTPPNGKAYYLVDERGDGRFARDDHLDSGLRTPRWLIHQF